jgi:asparagine synthase (glutamine-hydrolysing)
MRPPLTCRLSPGTNGPSEEERVDMCGICGLLNYDSSPADEELIGEMIATIRHRGPDDCGTFTDGNVGLGHSRLSIIDLAGGHQPMQNRDGTLSITFNGEIFNYIELRRELEQRGHRFATQSDTEVILHSYEEEGERCVDRFNGQWAFALWDSKRDKLFLSRDRLGVRPLFYAQTANSFLFASEIKALLASSAVSREIDLCGLDQIFTFWSTIPPRTPFKDIFQLPPGCSLTIEDKRLCIRQYWSISYPTAAESFLGNEEKLASELLDLLSNATRIRLRSDIPVGTYLSGGIDSTVTTALASAIVGSRLRSFSITFEDTEFDESRFQQEASSFLGTQHTAVNCSSQDIARVFPEVIWHAEQPILRAAPAPMFLLSKLVEESGFHVVVTGEGADEILGGYDIFKEAKIRRFWGRDLTSHFRPLLLKRLYPYMEGIQRQSLAYLQHFFRVTEQDLANPFFSHLPRWELTARLKLLFSADVIAQLRDYDAIEELSHTLPAAFHAWPPFNQGEYLEATGLLPGYILSSQGDRMAMAHSVEGRYPFLDHQVVEFAAKLSPDLKMKVLNEKYLLKRASAQLIPPSVSRRPKQPYRAPDGKCFFGHAAPDYVLELLSPAAVRKSGIFNPRAVTILVDKFRVGRATSTKDNMALIGVLSTQLLLHRFSNQTRRSCEQCHQRTSDPKFTTSS